MSLGTVEQPLYKYNYDDIKNVIFNGFDYQLPQYSIDIVNKISDLVGAPTYVKTPIFKKPSKWKKNNDDEYWDSLRNFKISKQDHNISDLDKLKQNIFLSINKMTETTYNVQKDNIFEQIDLLMKNEDYRYIENSEDYKEKLNSEIKNVFIILFNISISNEFNSNIYANLFKNLIEKYPLFNELLSNLLSKWEQHYNNIEFISSKDEYDKFCENNLKNEKRVAYTKFITSLYNNGTIDNKIINNIIDFLILQVNNKITDKESTFTIEQFSINLYTIIKNIESIEIKNNDIIKEHINFISNINIKEKKYLGINNKIIFKYMDIMDIL